MPSAVYAQAYATAQDHVCTLADQYLKLRSERSEYLGRGPGDANLASDLAYRALDIREHAQQALLTQDQETLDVARAFVAGYNRFLRERGGTLPAPCTGASWVQPIDELDFFAHLLDLSLLVPAHQLITAIARAQPPGVAPSFLQLEAAIAALPRPASNGWAIGRERTENGLGALLANPHFPWSGELRFHEAHLTVPGKLDVYGATLIGLPGIAIGFNEHLGWTHTFSASSQAVMYALALDPEHPTRYFLDGEPREMTRRTFEVEVAGEAPVTRTLYASEQGPLLDLDGKSWTNQSATAIAFANDDCYGLVKQYMRLNRARNLSEFKTALAQERSIPWANTVYADAAGNAYYVDSSRVPDLSPETLHELASRLAVDPGTQSLWALGVTLLDGTVSSSSFRDADGRSRIVPFAQAPQLTRQDYVQNANDAFTFTHPAASWGETSLLYLGARTLAAPRTRLGLELLAGGADAPSGNDGKWTRDELGQAVLRGDGKLANLLRDAVLARCEAAADGGAIDVAGTPVALAPACAALAGWDKRVNLSSRGAVMWREFLSEFSIRDVLDRGPLFAVGADPSDPIGTPRELTPAPTSGPDPIALALARALLRLQAAGIDPAIDLAHAQFWFNGERRIAVPGGIELEGPLNPVQLTADLLDTTLTSPHAPAQPIARGENTTATGLTDEGYYYDYGSSFLMALEFTVHGPRANVVMVYGQSADPASDFFADQTQLYLNKRFRQVQFREHDILADPSLTTRVLSND